MDSSYLVRRIAELESDLKNARSALAAIGEAVGRHPESHEPVEMAVRTKLFVLEAQAAERKEPLPDDVRAIVDQLRRSHINSGQTHRLIAFIDATFPKPVPQWERDALYLERKLGVETRSAYSPDEIKSIATRIREAHRGKE